MINLLIVDDEYDIRSTVKDIIKESELKDELSVVTAASAKEALFIFDNTDYPINLVLTDIKMPDIDGIALSHMLQTKNVDLRILFMTGYSDSTFECHRINPYSNILIKPFTARDLIEYLKRALKECFPC